MVYHYFVHICAIVSTILCGNYQKILLNKNISVFSVKRYTEKYRKTIPKGFKNMVLYSKESISVNMYFFQ